MAERRLENYPLLKIHGSIGSFSSAERVLAEYILDNPRGTIDSTIEELAERSGTSYATISRFCKKMGYSGYKEFKRSLIDDVVMQKREEISSPDLSIVPGLSDGETVARICRFTERIISDTEKFLDPNRISQAAEALLSASHVLCVGGGTSAITARYAYTRFFRLGIHCETEADPIVFSMRARTLGPGDVVLAVSSSGRTESVLKASATGHERGATVIAISDYAISPLNRAADITLYTTPRSATNFMTEEMPLLAGQVLIVDALFGVLTTHADKNAGTDYEQTRLAADTYKVE